jgi:hypothetical protein
MKRTHVYAMLMLLTAATSTTAFVGMVFTKPTKGPAIVVKEITTVKEVEHIYLSRMEVNDMIHHEIDAGRMEWIYLFYDAITGDRRWTHILLQTSLLYKVPVNLVFALAKRESNFDPWAENHSNTNGTSDYGLLQLNSGTFSDLSTKTLLDPSENALIGVQYLLTRHNDLDSWEKAVIAYNGGNGERIAQSAISHLDWVLAYEREFDRDITTAKSQQLPLR